MVRFGNTALANDVLANYQTATRMSPIAAQKRNQIFTTYGITPGWAKGKSDALISSEAARVVLARFQAEKERTAQAEAARVAAQAAAAKAQAEAAARAQAAQQQAAQQAEAARQQAAARPATTSPPAPAPSAPPMPGNVAGTGVGSQSGGTSGGPISVDRAIQIKMEYGRPDIMLGGEGTAWRAAIMSSEATFRNWLEQQIAIRPAAQVQLAAAATPPTAPAPISAAQFAVVENKQAQPAPAPQPYTSYYTYSYLAPPPPPPIPLTTYRVPARTVATVS